MFPSSSLLLLCNHIILITSISIVVTNTAGFISFRNKSNSARKKEVNDVYAKLLSIEILDVANKMIAPTIIIIDIPNTWFPVASSTYLNNPANEVIFVGNILFVSIYECYYHPYPRYDY